MVASARGGTSGRPGRSRPTIADVARRAGVALSTVSHAYSGNRPVAEDTRKRVLRAGQELGYVPNPHARAMRTGRTGMIGLALRPAFSSERSWSDLETFNRLTGGAAIACLRRGVGLVHLPYGDSGALEALPMDGCIVAHPTVEDPLARMLEARGMPTVILDGPAGAETVTPWRVDVDHRGGMEAIVSRLVRSGARQIWLLAGLEDNAWTMAARGAVDMIRPADSAERLSAHRVIDVPATASSADVERMLAAEIERRGAPDAIISAASDLVPALLSVLSARALRVPDDVQVATFTDTVHSRLADVTALDLRHEQLSELAVTALLERIDGADAPAQIEYVEPDLHWRSSTS